MIFAGILVLSLAEPDLRLKFFVVSSSAHTGSNLPSAPVILFISTIRSTNAQCGPSRSPQGGCPPRLDLRCRDGSVLHAVGGLPADRGARGRGRSGAAGAP